MCPNPQPSIWALAAGQEGVVSREQLFDAGLSRRAIQHRLATGRLYLLPFPSVYAVGRRELSVYGIWMAAVLSCGRGAALSHASAAALWGISRREPGPIHVSVPACRDPRPRGIRPHRRTPMPPTTTVRSIPVTQPLFTLIDLAASWNPQALDEAINEADKLGLINAAALPKALAEIPRRPGLRRLKAAAAAHQPTDSDLERRFLALVRNAGLPRPETQVRLNGYRVDFHWPELGLVVETDGLTYHRTVASQLEDRRRDQAHTAAGLTQLRFADSQVRREPGFVAATLSAVIARLGGR